MRTASTCPTPTSNEISVNNVSNFSSNNNLLTGITPLSLTGFRLSAAVVADSNSTTYILNTEVCIADWMREGDGVWWLVNTNSKKIIRNNFVCIRYFARLFACCSVGIQVVVCCSSCVHLPRAACESLWRWPFEGRMSVVFVQK